MFSTDDTIVAISTPPGRGGIGVVRVSGASALRVAAALLDVRGPVKRSESVSGVPGTPRVRDERSGAGAEGPHSSHGPGAPPLGLGGSHLRGSALAQRCGSESDGEVSRALRKVQGSPRVSLEPRRATFARLRPALDQVVATYFRAPASYTGEDVVEISAHGSPVVLRQILTAALDAGARLAEPGEFTFRAFLNGRIDLVQAEAVADLVDAVTPLQARAAFDQLEGTLTARIAEIDSGLFDLIARLEASLDFPEEGYHFVDPASAARSLGELDRQLGELLTDAERGRLIREGVEVAIVGKPNVGKSSLFNYLLGTSRAIVTAIPGTTRDLVTEAVDLEGLRISLVDTAGIRDTNDEVETEGVTRARRATDVADLVVLVLDWGRPLEAADRALLQETARSPRLVVVNKIDLPAAWEFQDLELETSAYVALSLKTAEGVERLRPRLVSAILGRPDDPPPRDAIAVTNIRHIGLLRRAQGALRRAGDALADPAGALPEEFVLTDLQDARAAFEEITGKRTFEDLLRHIFARFCIGK